ncbi:MAG: right-handed parallel beta-helix repeat-containing protein, partial [Bacteroides sp.]|nr:right-handed parallel beta-helix repeat-containing protein [Bacteroides sp.]
YWDDNPSFPKGNVIEGNLFYKIGNVVRGRTEWLELYNNWTTNADPGFVDDSNPLKGLKKDALVFQRIAGFPQLPFDEIGCNLPE